MKLRICQIDGCAKPVQGGHKLCPMHYRRKRVHGDPLKSLYRDVLGPDDYRRKTHLGKQKGEHVAKVEKILGYELPRGAEVHHWNEDKSDNRNANLVVCPNHAYHSLLHARARAFDACGHADWRRCNVCKQYDAPENLYLHPNAHAAHHRSCHAERAREWSKRKSACKTL